MSQHKVLQLNYEHFNKFEFRARLISVRIGDPWWNPNQHIVNIEIRYTWWAFVIYTTDWLKALGEYFLLISQLDIEMRANLSDELNI